MRKESWLTSFKKSKGGKLKLIKLNGQYTTVNVDEYPDIRTRW
jgi:hypothetical protein